MKNDRHLNKLTKEIISASIEVHRALGPGLLESAYQKCLGAELKLRNISRYPQLPITIDYKGTLVEKTYYLDFLVNQSVAVEVKAVDKVHPIHLAQLLTYLKLGKWKVGLLINFNEELLTEGVFRRVNNFQE